MKLLKQFTKPNCLFIILIVISSYFILQRYMGKRSMILEGLEMPKVSVKMKKKMKYAKKDASKIVSNFIGSMRN